MGSSLDPDVAQLTDPRVERTTRHALCAVICGADSWVAVERFGHAKQAWLRTFLALPHGIPCHDIFREDESRVRVGHGQEHFAVLRQIALHLLRRETTTRCGIKARRLMAGRDEAYLLKALAA